MKTLTSATVYRSEQWAIFQYEEYSSSEARSFQGWQKNKDRIGVVIA